MNKNIEVEGGEIAIRNSHGDLAIIPKNKRNWVKQKLSEGCHDCIDSLVETLPIASQYAQDGSVYPPNAKVKVNNNNQIKEYDINSSEYRDLYNSGRLMSYDKTSNTYIATPLEEVTVTAEAPQWLKYKRKYESQYTKDWYIDNNMPKFSRSMGVSADNMHPNNVKEYDSYINDKVVEDIFKSKPTFDEDYSNDRLKTLQGFSQKELELIKNSKYASKIEPSIWSKFEQGLLSVGNAGSPVTFKNENLTQKEAKKEDNPLNILQPLSVPSKMVQSVYKKDYSLKDALKGKQNNAGIVEDIVTDPLNLVGAGLVGKLSKADKVIDAAKAVDKISDISKPTNILKFDDFKNDNEFFRIIVGDEAFDDIIKTGQIRVQRPSSYKTEPGVINLDRRGTTPSPSFSKGKPSIEYAKGNPEHYIIRTSEPLKPSTMGAHGKGSTMFPTDEAGKHLKSLDASKTQVYKHIGNGEYELVDVTKAGSKVLNKTDDVVKTAISSVDDVNKSVKPAWQTQELPGLHLKSTMEGEAISKIVEPKTGLVNVEQALAIIGKESGGADKVALIKQGLGNNIPKKMDYNEFRKVVQDQLIPLERQFSTHSSEYGIFNLGYKDELNIYRSKIDEILNPSKKSIIENQTLILGNKGKFGRGSSAHGNPDETLGHIHFLRDAETPDVLTVTQIQSDAFQGTHRIMPKDSKNLTALEKQQKSLARMEELQKRNKSILHKMKTEGLDEAGLPVQDYQIKQFEDIVKAQEQSNLFKKADIENFTQKQLLDKNHQERYLQELVDYAGKRGDVNKLRVPTSETAAKVQGYERHNPMSSNFEYSDKYPKELNDLVKNVRNSNRDNYDDAVEKLNIYIENNKPNFLYSSEHQTILKKYAEQPKTIKKLFGVEPKVVTDSKGNTWYEFDIPKKFKEGKGEIKAFGLIPPAIGIGTAIQSQNQNKNEQ